MCGKINRGFFLSFLVLFFFASMSIAGEFKVNDDADTTANATPTIAASVSGKVVVCWESEIISDHYPGLGESEVRGQLFQSGSLPVAPDFQVAKKNLLNQKPDAAMDLTGNFVVAWTYWGIYDHQWVDAVSFDRDGNLSGTVLSEETQNNLSYADFPSICMDNDGNIVLACVDYWSRVLILRIDNAGNEVGGLIQVWEEGSSDQDFTDLEITCSNESGKFIVCWAVEGYDPVEKAEIYARLYHADGTPAGSAFSPVDGNAVTNLGNSIAVAMDPQGNFMISWKDFRNGNADIYAQGYKSDGTPIGGNFKVNDDTGSSGQAGPAVAGDGYGNFVFCWADGRNGNADIFAQKMKIQGNQINPLGPNFRVNEDRGDAAQGSPDVHLKMGTMYFTWTDHRDENQGSNIYAKEMDWDTELSLTVTAPNGGEIWQVGEEHTITWESSGIVGDVKIEFSNDGGENWELLAGSTPDDGVRQWTPKEKHISDNCLIRITNVEIPSISDVSDAPFSVGTTSLEIVSPNGGEIWNAGSRHEVLWNPVGSSLMNIELSRDGGENWELIAADIPDDGVEEIKVPEPASKNCLMKISNASGTLQDVSDAVFEITVPPMYAEADTTPEVGQEFWIDVVIGNDTMQVQDLLGVSFDLHYSPNEYVDAVSSEGSIVAGEFIGGDSMFHTNIDENARTVSVGITRTVQSGGVSGFGKIVSIKFISKTDTPDSTLAEFSFSNVLAINSHGDTLVVNPHVSEIYIIEKKEIVEVWPGDTNNDGTVTVADVLPVGLYYQATGAVREQASMEWCAQQVYAWDPLAATYADATGSGEVNVSDILPIALNYGKHANGAPSPVVLAVYAKTENATLPVITPQVDVLCADTIGVAIHVQNVDDLLGVAFDLNYSNVDGFSVATVQTSGQMGDELLSLHKVFSENGLICAGVTRRAQDGGISGNAEVYRFKFHKGANFSAARVVFTLNNVEGITSNGKRIEFHIEDGTYITSVTHHQESIPDDFQLYQNYPNPFNPSTTISFDLANAELVTLKLFNLRGQCIATVLERRMDAGRHSVQWQPQDVPSGVYVCKLRAGQFKSMIKMLFVK